MDVATLILSYHWHEGNKDSKEEDHLKKKLVAKAVICLEKFSIAMKVKKLSKEALIP
jgi:hypothetical protein